MRHTSFGHDSLRTTEGWFSVRRSTHLSSPVRHRFRLVLLIVSALVLATAPQVTAQAVSVTTYHNDNSRRGLNDKETILTHANVNPDQFGKLFSQKTDGYCTLNLLSVRCEHPGAWCAQRSLRPHRT